MARKPRFRRPLQRQQREALRRRVATAAANPVNRGTRAIARAAGVPRQTAYRMLKDVETRNFITKAFSEGGITAKKLAAPILDGLDACEVVRMQDKETGEIKILTDHPDYKTRFGAFDRAVEMYGLTAKQQVGDHVPSAPPRQVHVNIVFVKPPARDAPPHPGVTFVKSRHS